MIPFILVKYKGLPAIVERFFEIFACFHYLCLDSFKRSDRQGWEPSSNQMVGLFSSLSNGLVAFRYRNLVGTVLFGVVLIAVLRLVF